MPCSRCAGLLVHDHYLDYHSDNGTLWMSGWRCLNCGCVLDHVIQRNQARQERLRMRLLQPVADSGATAGRLIEVA